MQTTRRTESTLLSVLELQRNNIMLASKKILRTDSPVPLHDLRVSLRRFKTVLRVFRKELPRRQAKRLSSRISGLAPELGRIRDTDVWYHAITAPGAGRVFQGDDAAGNYIARQAHIRQANLNRLRKLVVGRSYKSVLSDIDRFIVAVSTASGIGAASAASSGQKALAKTLRKVLGHPGLRRTASQAETHELRRLCRRCRYIAEFVASVGVPEVKPLVRRLHHISDKLGELHDCDVASGMLEAGAPKRFSEFIKQRRRKAWKEFRSAWARLSA